LVGANYTDGLGRVNTSSCKSCRFYALTPFWAVTT